jgi:hypothetical protein
LYIAAAVHDVNNERVRTFGAVDDNVFPHGEGVMLSISRLAISVLPLSRAT